MRVQFKKIKKLTFSSWLKFSSTAQFATLLSSGVSILTLGTVFAFCSSQSVLILPGIAEGTLSQRNWRTGFSFFTIFASILANLILVLSFLAIVATHWKSVRLVLSRHTWLTKDGTVLVLVFSCNTSSAGCLTCTYLGFASITLTTCCLASCCVSVGKKEKGKRKKEKGR